MEIRTDYDTEEIQFCDFGSVVRHSKCFWLVLDAPKHNEDIAIASLKTGVVTSIINNTKVEKIKGHFQVE